MARQAKSSPPATPAKKTPAKSPTQPRAEVHWESDSKKTLCEWPAPIRTDFGIALEEMQRGKPASLEVRPMPSVGKGVFELKTDDASSWYRLMYLARVEDVIYVLDCFKKKTRRTENKDLDRSRARFKKVQQRISENRTDAKQNQQTKPRNKGQRS